MLPQNFPISYKQDQYYYMQKNSLGLFTVSQKIEITSIKDGTQVRLSYPYNLGQSFVETGFQSCDAIVRNGKIFVSDVSEAYRIRTGEKGGETLN